MALCLTLTTLGKVIGGGMPVGAFGGKRAIMEKIAPLGPVYQAGTLSGNPVAVAAGLATLRAIAAPGFYDRLAERTRQLTTGLVDAANRAGVAFSAQSIGGMFGIYFARHSARWLCDGDGMRQGTVSTVSFTTCSTPESILRLRRTKRVSFRPRTQVSDIEATMQGARRRSGICRGCLVTFIPVKGMAITKRRMDIHQLRRHAITANADALPSGVNAAVQQSMAAELKRFRTAHRRRLGVHHARGEFDAAGGALSSASGGRADQRFSHETLRAGAFATEAAQTKGMGAVRARHRASTQATPN